MLDLPVATVNVCTILLSPLVGAVPPICAAYVPECAPLLTTAVVPDGVQPVGLPVSNPPLTMPPVTGAVTVSVNVAECGPPLAAVPVTMMVELPVAALLATVRVSVEVPLVLTEAGLNDAVTPLGIPDAESAT